MGSIPLAVFGSVAIGVVLLIFAKNGNAELTIEVQLRENEIGFVKSINNLDGIENVIMVSYNGDYMS